VDRRASHRHGIDRTRQALAEWRRWELQRQVSRRVSEPRNGICNTVGRAATIVSPFIVLALFRNYGATGVLALMVGVLIIHIIVIAVWGIEPANRGLEDLETVTA
jgi:hypothetical protein